MTSTNPYGSEANHHVLSVLVQNRPGVLARVASLFARRGYNIFSLAVAPTEQEDYSRITIVVDLESATLEQMVKQLFKLVDVVRISELDPRNSVERELMVATIRATPEQAKEVASYADGVIVGSAFIKLLLDAKSEQEGLDAISHLARELALGVREGR